MGVKLGTLDISSFKVGSADCKVYLGETLLYSGDTPTPPTPTAYTWTTIDDTFTSQQTPIPVYEIHVDWLTTDDNNQSFGFYDNPSFSSGYQCTIDYDENSGLYELLIYEYPNWITAYTHSYSSSTDINLDFIAIFGKPMYFNSPPQEQGNCLDEQCAGYDCLDWGCVDWDPDTGECIMEDCIQQGDCIDWICMQYEIVYIATAKIIQQN